MGRLGNLVVFSPSDMECRVFDKPAHIYNDDHAMITNDRSRAHLAEFWEWEELISVFIPQRLHADRNV